MEEWLGDDGSADNIDLFSRGHTHHQSPAQRRRSSSDGLLFFALLWWFALLVCSYMQPGYPPGPGKPSRGPQAGPLGANGNRRVSRVGFLKQALKTTPVQAAQVSGERKKMGPLVRHPYRKTLVPVWGRLANSALAWLELATAHPPRKCVMARPP